MSNPFPPSIGKFLQEIENPAYKVEPIAFFATFSRFEYAMKRVGYAKGVGRSKACEPNWTDLENKNGETYNNIELDGLLQARNYFNNMPPRKQVYSGDEMKWKEVRRNGQSDLAWHSQSVRRVRNNLFHGEKTQAFRQIGANLPEQEEPSRNFMLIRHSLVMLAAFLECDDKIKQIFHDYIPGEPK